MDIDILKSELLAGHPDTGAYNADSQLAADQTNLVNRTKVRAISMTELREWASVGARAFSLKAAIDNVGLTDQVRSLAIIGDKMLGTDDAQLDPGNASHVAFVNELVTAGVWTSADRAALVAKATDSLSRAAELGLGAVKAGHVQEARI